ncbi:MAG TPA: hypothetical protein VIF12_07790 [Micavibrio sp.]
MQTSQNDWKQISLDRAEYDRLRAVATEQNRGRSEVINFFIADAFNKAATDPTLLQDLHVLAPVPKNQPRVLTEYFIDDFKMDEIIKSIAFAKEVLPSQVYRTLIVAGLNHYESLKANGQPFPQIPINQERRDASDEAMRRMAYTVRTGVIAPRYK